MAEESLSILAYGPAGGGKTTLGLTGPKPILLLDAETASRFIPKSRKIAWDPMKDSPPVYDGTWEICVVKIKNWATAQKTLEYIRSDNHPFQTVMIDSISEIQIKAKDEIKKRGPFQLQDWGVLGQNMGSFLRDLRDISASDESKIRVCYLISTAKEYSSGENQPRIWKPFLEGSTANIVPYLFDMTAYIYLEEVLVNQANPTQGTQIQQVFFTGSHPTIEAKSRPPGVPPQLTGITLEGLLNGVFPESTPTPAPERPDAPPVEAPPVVEEEVKKEAPAETSSGLPAFNG